ncbi:MAG: DUF1838 family protein [Cellvibrionales bacterium]|nr:DUF1838 family protein [Cellvibrionales bacterium]
MKISTTLAYLAALLLATGPVLAGKIDPNTAAGYVQLNRKIQCSLKDEDPQVYGWSGRGYSRVPGERDRHLFNVEGMNIRQCVSTKDKVRGTGYRLVSREIMLYLDPKTDEILRTWENPWTGARNEVVHVANDPVNFGDFGKTKDGKAKSFELRDVNGTFLMQLEVPLFYTNPLGGNYQKYVGGTYHATEIFDFNGSTEELLDDRKPVSYPVISWVRIAQWLPWMEMGSRSGLLYFNAMGKKLNGFQQLPAILKDEIAANYPEYTAPPPTDDKRPNETSWTYMKKIIDKRGGGKNADKPRH